MARPPDGTPHPRVKIAFHVPPARPESSAVVINIAPKLCPIIMWKVTFNVPPVAVAIAVAVVVVMVVVVVAVAVAVVAAPAQM